MSKLEEFAEQLKEVQASSPQKYSARGWAYILEGYPVAILKHPVTKIDFDSVQGAVNKCRGKGYLPINFVLEDEGRAFKGVEYGDHETPKEYVVGWLDAVANCERTYTPDWWDGEKYYIQMIVEKIDLREMFGPICAEYHIPIATTKGWSSMLQRAEYARRFKEAEERGLKCVLLQCGDHDPDGLRISDTMRANLEQLTDTYWIDGTEGYDPKDLTIDRFGLNFDFIQQHGLTWIDNLITGSGLNLANPRHKNYNLPYVQEYLHSIGIRKCEANAILRANVRPAGLQLCRNAIETYLGTKARRRFQRKKQKVVDKIVAFKDETGITEAIQEAIKQAGEGDDEK